MKNIEVQIISGVPHVTQVLSGFYELNRRGEYSVKFKNMLSAPSPYSDMSVVRVLYNGRVLIYDLLDGYIGTDRMTALLGECDLYFKRSFSAEKNASLPEELSKKMRPLGFNYHVTHKGCPINDPPIKRLIKALTGKESMNSFTKEKFEGKAEMTEGGRILFLTRLWDPDECVTEAGKNERIRINSDRIEIINALRKKYGDRAVTGLSDTPLARRLAPELIMDGSYTKRANYIKLLHSSDICIASTGLHSSIGWKTGEYVAAAKAIVTEPFAYEVTGDFEYGKNCLTYVTPRECLDAVETLIGNPDALYGMKKENEKYYRAYLSPDALVRNTLKIADGI